VPMLGHVIDAVIGVDTHRDTHEIELASPAGTPLATLRISNDTAGCQQFLAAAEQAPGPRVVVAIEGARSYGIGLARAAAAAGLRVFECGQPARAARHGAASPTPIDAHLAVLYALRLDADRLPQPRADGNREALRILLAARANLVTAQTAQVNGSRPCCATAPTPTMTSPAGRNRADLRAIVDDLAPATRDAAGQRRRLRWPARAPASQQRPHHPSPPQPQRRPRAPPGHPHHRAHPHAQLRPDPRLRRAQNRRGQGLPRYPQMPQTPHHPRALPRTHHRHGELTTHRSVEASGPRRLHGKRTGFPAQFACYSACPTAWTDGIAERKLG
jgi:hypothetical protein